MNKKHLLLISLSALLLTACAAPSEAEPKDTAASAEITVSSAEETQTAPTSAETTAETKTVTTETTTSQTTEETTVSEEVSMTEESTAPFTGTVSPRGFMLDRECRIRDAENGDYENNKAYFILELDNGDGVFAAKSDGTEYLVIEHDGTADEFERRISDSDGNRLTVGCEDTDNDGEQELFTQLRVSDKPEMHITDLYLFDKCPDGHYEMNAVFSCIDGVMGQNEEDIAEKVISALDISVDNSWRIITFRCGGEDWTEDIPDEITEDISKENITFDRNYFFPTYECGIFYLNVQPAVIYNDKEIRLSYRLTAQLDITDGKMSVKNVTAH